MRLRRLCLEIFAFRRFFSEPIEISRFPGAQCKHRKRRDATVLSFCREVLQGVAHQVDMLFRLYLAKNRRDPPATVDDESAALRAHVFFSIHAFFNPYAVAVHDFLFGIGENRKRQIVFVDELSVTPHGIDTDAENFRFLAHATPGIAKAAGLHRAAGRVVFRIKIENDGRALKTAKGYVLAVAVFAAHRERIERRRFISHFQFVAGLHVSNTMIRIPTAHSKTPISTLSYFSNTPSFSLLRPARVSDVNRTIPATVAMER